MIIRDTVGNAIAYKDFGGYILIHALQVFPQHRRKGFGSKLLGQVKAFGKRIILTADAGFDKNSGISQEALDNFYVKNGFKHSGNALQMHWEP